MCIRDSIKPEDLNKVLDPAMYFTTYGTGKEEGSGLGLQLCLDLVPVSYTHLDVYKRQSRHSAPATVGSMPRSRR